MLAHCGSSEKIYPVTGIVPSWPKVLHPSLNTTSPCPRTELLCVFRFFYFNVSLDKISEQATKRHAWLNELLPLSIIIREVLLKETFDSTNCQHC